MSSGVKVHADCMKRFDEMKLGHKYRYIIFALSEGYKEICVLKTASPDKTYDDFVNDLKEAEDEGACRYATFDANFTLPSGQKRNKLLLFQWCPERAKLKEKMVYSSSKQYIKSALQGVSKEVQANDHSDLCWSDIEAALVKSEVDS